MFLKVDNVGAVRMCSGILFQATGPSTQNARLPSRRGELPLPVLPHRICCFLDSVRNPNITEASI